MARKRLLIEPLKLDPVSTKAIDGLLAISHQVEKLMNMLKKEGVDFGLYEGEFHNLKRMLEVVRHEYGKD